MTDRRIEARDARILVVEDDPNNRLVITRLLKLAGISPERVWEYPGDPAAFFDERPEGVDIVFLDIQLPKKDGYAILKELRARPESAGATIVALTANVMHQDIERAREAGFDGFIGKPIDGRRFTEVMGRILAGEAVWTAR